jgi:hypothetical protein
MTENFDPMSQHDGKYIQITNDDDVQKWALTFGVTRQRLIAAIDAVGGQAHVVEAYLRQSRNSLDEIRLPPSAR